MEEKPSFTADAAGFIWRASGYCAVFAMVMSALLAGAAWVSLLIASLAALALPLAAVFLLFRRLRPLRFDDATASVVPAWGSPIRRDEIHGWTLREEGVHFSVEARLSTGKTRRLALALPEAVREPLEHAIEQRQPDVLIAQRHFPTQALVIGLLAPILVLYGPFVWYLDRNHPAVFTELSQVDWLHAAPRETSEASVTVGEWEIHLPPGFRPGAGADGEHRYLDPASETQVTLRAEPLEAPDSPAATRMLLRAFGVSDSFDLLSLAYGARSGIIPILLKIAVLGDASSAPVELWRFEREDLQGLLELTTLEDTGRANLLLRSGSAPTTLLIAVRSPQKPSRELISRLVAGVRPPL